LNQLRLRHQPRRQVLTAVHYGWLALGILLLTVYGSLIPFQFQPQPPAVALNTFEERILSANGQGSHSWVVSFLAGAKREARGDWVLSGVLFLILSYLLMAAVCVDRPWLRGLKAALAVWLFCIALSVAVEFVQIYFEPRTVARIDIALAALGALTGVVLWLSGGQRLTQWGRRLWSATGVSGLAARLLPGYLVLLLIVELMPFDLLFSRAELAVKYHEGKIWFVPFHYRPAETSILLAKTLWNMACFFPLGFLKVLVAGRASWAARSWPRVFLMGLGFTTLVEFLQLFVYSRFFDTSDIVTGAVAVLLGWWLGVACQAYWQRDSSGSYSPARDVGQQTAGLGRLAVGSGLLLGWLAVATYFNWQPFDFTATPAHFAGDSEETPAVGLSRMSWVPLVNYYWGSKYQAFEQVRMKMLSFVPLGVLAALCLRRQHGHGAGLLVLGAALVLALGFEIGQCFLPGRGADVTDVLIEGFGAWLGFALTRQIRSVLGSGSATVETPEALASRNGQATNLAATLEAARP